MVRPDSTESEALMRNDWEWDKHLVAGQLAHRILVEPRGDQGNLRDGPQRPVCAQYLQRAMGRVRPDMDSLINQD